MNHLSAAIVYANRLVFSFWGLTIADMVHFIDLDYLSFLNTDLKQIFAFLGLIYFIIQIPFKIIELNHKRKINKVDLQIKENQLTSRTEYEDFLELRKDYLDN
jgi:hypothetical protein